MKRLYLTLLSSVVALSAAWGQATIFTPANSGGFENGGTFALNTWTEVNGAFNAWAVGNGSVNVGMRGAYIGNATTYVGSNNAAINHFYRSNPGGVTIPAGATSVMLTFRYRQPVVDPGGDSLIVSTAPVAAPTPVAGATPSPVYTRLYRNTATAYPGYVQIGPIDLTAYAGTSQRLVFTHVNNGTGAIGIPAVDSISVNYCPAITAAVYTVCPGSTITLNCANPALGGTWSSSNTAIASFGGTTLNTAVVNGVAAGTATITHTGGTCTVTATVTVSTPPTVTGNLQLCMGTSNVFTVSPTGGTWQSSNTGVATVTSGTVTPAALGTANITYTNTCRTISQVTVSPLPTAFSMTGGGSFCPSGTGVPVGLLNSAMGVNYTLYNGATAVTTVGGTGGAISFGTIATAGTYTATASNTTTTCVNNMTGSAVVTVTSPVTPSVSITSSAGGTLCSGTSVTFTANPINGGLTPAYDWYVNGTAAGSGAGYTYVPANGDILRVTLRPGGICVAPDTATISNTLSVTPLATPGVNIVVNPNNPSCLGRPVTFSATPIMGGTSPAYRWTKNGTNVATGPTYSYTPAAGDVVHCMITSNYICRSIDTALSTDITMITQATASLPVVTIATSPGTTIAPGTMVTFSATKTGGTAMVDYQWHVNGSAMVGATNATYSTNTLVNGDIVTCKATNTDPCANFSLKSVVISTGASGVGMIEPAISVAIVPNPNNGTFTVMGAINEDAATIRVTNLMGQTVYTGNAQVATHTLNETLNLSNLPAGMYILSINTASGMRSLHFSITE